MKASLKDRKKFYTHLKVFLIVVGLSMLTTTSSGFFFNIRPWMVFWGIGLLAHYYGVFGDCGRNRAEPLEDPRQKKGWRNKDLV